MKCAYVEWMDSVHLDDWNPGTEIPDAKCEHSCGLLLRDTEQWVTIALSFAPETEQYGHIISIPRVAIKSIQIFNKPTTKRAKRAMPPQEVQGD